MKIKFYELEKIVLNCNKGKITSCENCPYKNCNKEDYEIILKEAQEKERQIKREKELLKQAKEYYINLGYEVHYSRTYKQYVLDSDKEQIFKGKGNLINDYLRSVNKF